MELCPALLTKNEPVRSTRVRVPPPVLSSSDIAVDRLPIFLSRLMGNCSLAGGLDDHVRELAAEVKRVCQIEAEQNAVV